ncbi:MAG: glycosyltransferase [Candidatus Rokubacteria bacterium]|nr:glycosyltransferase [Candidatus Rokubacteria bacterium]
MRSRWRAFEVIVVDDGSTDDTAEVARRKNAEVVRLPRRSGPAGARNRGAQLARGEIVCFLDSDVLVREDTLDRVVATLRDRPDVAAVFGSYDDSPAAPDWLSQFRNLFHHFIHQQAEPEAKTFWAGCGAIYRDVFRQLQGFDERRYREPSVEDIELGLRMWRRGYRIVLDKTLQVKHLKRWEWRGWLRTDIYQRAIPWSKLILETGVLPRDLNLQMSHRISALWVGLLALALPLMFLENLAVFGGALYGALVTVSLLLVVTLLVLNRKMYAFFWRKRGIGFMAFAIPLHFLYYFYSGLAFVLCWVRHKVRAGVKRASRTGRA